MGGAAGGGFTHGGPGAYGGRARVYDDLYGPGWQEAALKTLAQELKERGIEPRSGDDAYQLVPSPRLAGDRFAICVIAFVILGLGAMACWAWWEYLPYP